MALKLMPGETRNYTFKLPDPISSIDSIDVRFFQDGGKIVEYDETQTDNVYQVAGEENLLVCTLPRADTLLFENKIPASVQIEWSSAIFETVESCLDINICVVCFIIEIIISYTF